MITRPVNLASTGAVIATGGGVLKGFYVNSTSGGIIRLYNGTTSADIGQPLGGVITPAIGYHDMSNLSCTAGCYFTISSGSINVTFHVLDRE